MATIELLSIASHRHRELMRALAAELRRLRLDRGLSQRIVALAADIDPSMLSRIEAGHREPSFETLVALAAALGAEPGAGASRHQPAAVTRSAVTRSSRCSYTVWSGFRRPSVNQAMTEPSTPIAPAPSIATWTPAK